MAGFLWVLSLLTDCPVFYSGINLLINIVARASRLSFFGEVVLVCFFGLGFGTVVSGMKVI